jgi:hypothetical protein
VRGARYCELLLVALGPAGLEARVYNTIGLNDCPAALWQSLDLAALKAQFGVLEILPNGPRYWLMDRMVAAPRSPEVVSFGGLDMQLAATIRLTPGAGLRQAMGQPYTEHSINRDTQWIYNPGSTVYELVGPDQRVYVMQSYCQIVDATLDEQALATLGQRLHLPAGWSYRARQLDAELNVRTVGAQAVVVQDELRNTYQRFDS